METFTVTDPCDRENPIALSPATDSLIYHGTHSMFCQVIEREGFRSDSFAAAYGVQIRIVVEACDLLNFLPDGYAAAQLRSDKVFFTAAFTLARGYAINVGGEKN